MPESMDIVPAEEAPADPSPPEAKKSRRKSTVKPVETPVYKNMMPRSLQKLLAQRGVAVNGTETHAELVALAEQST